MYSQVTRAIEVTVRPIYLRQHSVPEQGHFVWAYHVRLENRGKDTVQLLNRYWHITDGNGQIQEVRGPGVVGQHPVLRPAEIYEYSSFTHLPTPNGAMRGTYEMRNQDGEVFDIAIPRFSLMVACRLVVSN